MDVGGCMGEWVEGGRWFVEQSISVAKVFYGSRS